MKKLADLKETMKKKTDELDKKVPFEHRFGTHLKLIPYAFAQGPQFYGYHREGESTLVSLILPPELISAFRRLSDAYVQKKEREGKTVDEGLQARLESSFVTHMFSQGLLTTATLPACWT